MLFTFAEDSGGFVTIRYIYYNDDEELCQGGVRFSRRRALRRATLPGVAPRADGTFRLLVKSNLRGMRYRVTIAGPNLGSTLAPDASAITPTTLG